MSSFRISLVAVVLLLVACGGPIPRPATPARPRGAPAPIVDAHPYCADSLDALPCGLDGTCESGYTCADGWCQPLWAADCQPRCIPRTHPQVLCHGNGEIHGLWPASRDVRWMSVLEPARDTNCGASAWRVWGVIPDDRPRALLDAVVDSTWYATGTFCADDDAADLPKFFTVNPSATVYLLMDPGYPNAGTGLVTPP